MVEQHTPGPWKLTERSGYYEILGPRQDANWYGAKGIWAVAYCDTDLDEDVTIANGNLIAAAPDLLKELDVREGDLVMLRKAIECGDPRAELFVRIDDMLRDPRSHRQGNRPMTPSRREQIHIRDGENARLAIAVDHHAAVRRGVLGWMRGQREIFKGVL